MSPNQAILSAVIGSLFLLIVLKDQLIKPVEIKRNISTKIEWNPFPLSIPFGRAMGGVNPQAFCTS
jgi:hypothetical protein